MNRRGFLGSILALGAAPAIVRADSLMRIVPMDGVIVHRIPPMVMFPNPTFTGSVILTVDQITAEALRIAHERAQFINSINREWQSEFEFREARYL